MVEWKRQNSSPFTKSAVPKLNELNTCKSLGHGWVIPEEPHILMCVFSEEKWFIIQACFIICKWYILSICYDWGNLSWFESIPEFPDIQESFYIIVDFLKEKALKYNHYYFGLQIIPWFIDFFFINSWIYPRNIYF